MKKDKLTKIVVSNEEIWAATRPLVQKNKKKYTRKGKAKIKLKKAFEQDTE